MDLTVASGFKSKPAFLPSETAQVPDRSPQAEGPHSPAPDDPSPSTPPSEVSTFPSDHVTGLDGVGISSTSPPYSPPPKDSLRQQPREMYDPFSPTDAEKEERAVEDDEEKYDPFEPTGSPASDNDLSTEDLKSLEVEDQVQSDESAKKMEGGVEEPPDSMDMLADSLKPRLCLLSLRRTVDCSTIKEEHTDSEHSEIEEGEIVGLADREAGLKRPVVESLSVNSPSSTFFASKPERILRVLDGDGFVSVRADPDWPVDLEPEEEPVVGVEDLRRKLVSRRKERYIRFPGSSISLTTEPSPPSGHLHSPPPTPPPAPLEKEDTKTCKISNDLDGQKSKDRKSGDKEEKRKKKRKDKRNQHKSKEKQDEPKSSKELKSKGSSHGHSSKKKKRQHGSTDATAVELSSRLSQERSTDRPRDMSKHRDKGKDLDRDRDHSRHKNRSLERSRDRKRERSRDRNRERNRSQEKNRGEERSRDGEQDKEKDRARYWDRHRDRDRDYHHRSQRNDEGDSRGGRKRGRDSRSRERDCSKSSKRSLEKNEDHERHRDREGERERDRERERRRDGRPVVPPSIQDLNGSDLFAIKRTITVTTTTTTTTVPGSPRLNPASPSRSSQDMDKSHRKKKRKGRSSPGKRDCSRSLSPLRYHNYESDRYSDKLDIDVLSLDGEALDSDYPSLEDTPPPAPPPPLPSPKVRTTSKSGQLKRKALKKNSESSRTKSKILTSTSDCAAVLSGLPMVKRMRKVKDKTRDKGSRKDLGRSGKSKRDGTTSRKGKLQSKVSVLVREGVSSTTGSSGKLGMDLLGTGGPVGGAGSSVVGGSIAVVFCRDNESRSPFLKPCSEPLSLAGRGKDLSSMGKRSCLNAPPSSMNSPAVLPSQKAKHGSITSTSSSASSPSSSLVTKRRRRLVKKTREKGGAGGSKAEEGGQSASSVWVGASTEPLTTSGEVCKAASPHPGPVGSVPCSSSSSSSSSSTSVLPPSSSPPPSPPPSAAPMRDMRESSPDSQTVDSSCKTPEPSFLAEECPSQTSPTTPPSSSPSTMPTSLSTGLSLTPTDPPKPCSPPPCPSSSAACGLSSLSLDPSSSSVSSSSASKPPPPPLPPAASALPWSLQTGVDCTAGGVLALTALLFKMEEANIASRAKAQEFIQATSQILSQANQNQPTPTALSQVPPPPSLPPPPRVSPAQFMLHNSSHLHPCAQTPPLVGLSGFSGSSGDSGWDNDNKDPDKYLKKLHTQERAVEEVKLAIKPYYQRKDINKDDYKDILRKAVHKICHSRTGEINPVKVSNLVKLYVQRYKYFRKHGRKMDDDRDDREPGGLYSSA
ncbi:uncharacterized protein [Eucyclogobius newberryi]|uniref:uncharacterized protein scaf1 n=1 Tax=Eucyclogobius newberryi TaxID=166745 RepID=UPI003B5987D5